MIRNSFSHSFSSLFLYCADFCSVFARADLLTVTVLYSLCLAQLIIGSNYNKYRCLWKQRWSPRRRPWPRGRPRGHNLKSLALASRPQVLENWPVLGSRTALFFGMLKFCGALEKLFGKRFLVEIA